MSDLTPIQFVLLICGLPLVAFALPWLVHWWQGGKPPR